MRAPQWFLEAAVLSLAAAWLCLSKPTDKRSTLLPPSLLPEHYEISLAPRSDKGVFHGVVIISGVAVTETNRIVLHCRNLLFNTTILTDLTTDEEVEVEDIEEDELLQQCHLFLNQSLQLDHEYRLSMEFMGVISKEGVGLYRDYYKEEGVKREILMTHFQPNYARTMFPCFDEPHYKAQFLLRVTQQQFPTILSNMPLSTASLPDPEDNNQTWVEFEETPPMSTYLLVLIMSDYLALSDSATNTSVWAPRNRLHEAQFALNVSVAVLEQCERYFKTMYSLPKLDHVPVPSLNTVAMENWGAITYQKEFLLWEEGVSTWAQKETIAHVICHEVVHQWLGNLVTMAWWNTTWLNEGVTSFYHYYIMNKVEPSWNVMDTLFVTQILIILDEEAIKNPKPLTNNEQFSEDTISTSAFGASTYLKGAAIIRMVFNLMAPDVFREAIVQYIIDNEYESVDEEDLWQSLAMVSDLSVNLEEVMYSWTHQPGYPLVTVTRASDGCISVRQEKYLGEDESDARWTIPLTYTTSTELDFNFSNTVWFPESESELDLDICLEATDWIILNIRQTGFYRVNYDLLTWRLLTYDLNYCDLTDIHPVNRAQLLHDGFDLASHGLLEFRVILELSRYLSRETEYLPWSVGIMWLNHLRVQLYHTNTFPHFQRYALGLLEDMFHKMTLSGEAGGLLNELHRKQVVEFACSLRHPRCVKEATDTAYLLMSGVDVRIPLDLKPVLLCAAVRHGQDEVWHFVLKEYLGAAENERWKYLAALACTTKNETIQRLLKDISNPNSFVKSNEDRLNLFMDMGKQDRSLGPILDMILTRYHVLVANYDFELILQLLKSFLPPIQTPEEKKKITSIAILVSKTQSPRQTELMDSIVAMTNRPDKNLLHEVSVTEWFVHVNEEDENHSPPPPKPTNTGNDTPAVTYKTDAHEIQPTESNAIEEDDSGENDSKNVDGQDSDVSEEMTDTKSEEADYVDPGGSAVNRAENILFIIVILCLCVIR